MSPESPGKGRTIVIGERGGDDGDDEDDGNVWGLLAMTSFPEINHSMGECLTHRDAPRKIFGDFSFCGFPPMVPLTFYSLCAHKISFVQHLTTVNLYVELSVRNMCKHIFKRNTYVCSKFSCVRSSHDQCAHCTRTCA